MPMTEEEVFAKVRDVLTSALAVDEDEVRPEAKLTQDLGAESIDYLDIQFQLEKAFSIKIQPGDMSIESFLTNPELVSNGKLTTKGLDELKKRMPFAVADMAEFEKDPDISKFRDVFTVNTMVHFVMYKLAANPA
jgi:acyl carrier protein